MRPGKSARPAITAMTATASSASSSTSWYSTPAPSTMRPPIRRPRPCNRIKKTRMTAAERSSSPEQKPLIICPGAGELAPERELAQQFFYLRAQLFRLSICQLRPGQGHEVVSPDLAALPYDALDAVQGQALVLFLLPGHPEDEVDHGREPGVVRFFHGRQDFRGGMAPVNGF